MKYKPRNISLYSFLVFVIGFGACKKFIEVQPPTTNITDESVFTNDITAIAAVTGVYSNISRNGLTTPDLLTLSKLVGLSADEFDLWSGAQDRERAYYQNALYSQVGNGHGGELWNVCYGYIFDCNQVIEGINNSNSLSSSIKKQLLGEAKFIRAFLYYNLVNLYGDVALVTSTDVTVNSQVPRTSKEQVFNLIIQDLQESSELLSAKYLNSSLIPYTTNPERIRPTKWAALALLSRVYLYTNNYIKAEEEATKLITESSLFDLAGVPLNAVFLKNSMEAIWQLQPVSNGWNTTDARWFNLSATPSGFGSSKTTFISTWLYNAFENGDDRKFTWIGTYTTTSPVQNYYFPAKYKAGQNAAINSTNPGAITEYHMVLRLAEQYLIRAEARAKQGNPGGSQSDLNAVRNRAGLPNTTASDEASLLTAILKERQVELFSEWGHRWFDLKRTGKVNEVMSVVTPLKGGSWQSTDQLYPIPIDDLTRNPNLVQNPGY